MTRSTLSVLAGLALGTTGAVAQNVVVDGGQTSVILDFDTLAAAASLDFSGVSADVIAPGDLAGSVAFGINARDASSPQLPTSFGYNAGDFLGTFAGTIEHSGSVFFNSDTVEVGNFTIAFDAGRVGGDRSGFFVESTVGVQAILFDVGAPSTLQATDSVLNIGAALLVSAEFGGFLFDNGLSTSNLAGATVGEAFVNATAVPTPGVLALAGGAGLIATRRRR